jgi:hypothetical protein
MPSGPPLRAGPAERRFSIMPVCPAGNIAERPFRTILTETAHTECSMRCDDLFNPDPGTAVNSGGQKLATVRSGSIRFRADQAKKSLAKKWSTGIRSQPTIFLPEIFLPYRSFTM